MSDESRKERQILMVMRKVLAQIIKDTSPEFKTMKHPLSGDTIEDIRQCLALIAARERELADAAGVARERPYYADEKPSAEVVPLHKVGKVKRDED
jgi:hypothetical protein